MDTTYYQSFENLLILNYTLQGFVILACIYTIHVFNLLAIYLILLNAYLSRSGYNLGVKPYYLQNLSLIHLYLGVYYEFCDHL